MLTMEKIEALLKINTQNEKDNRALRIMSCDNPVKDLFVYELKHIRQELKLNPQSFEEQLAMCIYKYNLDLNEFLNGNIDNVNVKDSTIQLNKELINNAINEIYSFLNLLIDIVKDSNYSSKTIHDIIHFKFESYTAILQICGLINISDNVFRSKLIARVLNVKEQTINFKEERMSMSTLCHEFRQHIDFFANQISLIEENELTDEDFIIYVIMFDIRHYKHNRKNKVLSKY